MRRLLVSLAALGLSTTLAACGGQPPATPKADSGAMMNPDSMPMKEGMKDGMAAGSEAVAAKTATGSGVVTAIDKAAGTVTIQHGPIATIEWPAMTMAFKADPPSLLDTVKVGDHIEFDMTTEGNRVTAIRRR